MMVASLDPVGHTVSLLSLPRDLIDMPLGNGDTFGPKLNSLMSYADRNPKQFPKGGMRTLEDAVGALLDIPIHYYARLDFRGLIKMVDAVGGVDIVAPRAFEDPGYDGYGLGRKGFSITAGKHHLDGADALAYARSRKALGESDFTGRPASSRSSSPCRPGVPRRQPALPAARAARRGRQHDPDGHARGATAGARRDRRGGRPRRRDGVVIRSPLVHPKSTRYGDSQAPDLARSGPSRRVCSATRARTRSLAVPEAHQGTEGEAERRVVTDASSAAPAVGRSAPRERLEAGQECGGSASSLSERPIGG